MPLRAQRASPGTVAVHPTKRISSSYWQCQINSKPGKIGAVQEIVRNGSDQQEFDIPLYR
uniref:DUF2147 domain-containing protein n=1 Tax=Bursaphelenchus xylophilus TaxID=6326 RepID=A0A1I7RXC5_BURXY